MNLPVYLDYNATTPVDPLVVESMLPYLYTNFGNPSSNHFFGSESKKAIERARKQISDLLQCGPDEIIFTSGGSESNNLAIRGIAFLNKVKGNHIITSSVEHPAVIEVCHFLEVNGFKITYLPVDEYGLVDPLSVENAITQNTILITIMHANNEIGTIQPVEEIGMIAKFHGIPFHSDCAQTLGKINVLPSEMNADLLSIAGHKFYAPKGVGVLYLRAGMKLEKLIYGANHEMNLRAGTENVMAIVGIGKAADLVNDNLHTFHDIMKKRRDRFEDALKNQFDEIKINGHPNKRLPNTLSISFPGIEANVIISELSNVAVSAGAACHSDNVELSTTLKALNLPIEYAMGTIRISTGRITSEEEVEFAIKEFENVIKRLSPKLAFIPNSIEREKIKLTKFTHGLGCACKMRPQLLEIILQKLPKSNNENILVGSENSDDAAVYKLDDNSAIVQTVDFFTPIVNDPFEFGAISATNSLSDIYAMGAKPLFALNIVGFPTNRLHFDVLEKILDGAQYIAQQAGIEIIGGHSIEDVEPKFGWAVTGLVNPQRIVRNCTPMIGDVLVLTKPIGTGILSTALKQNLMEELEIKKLTKLMMELNKNAAEAMMEVGVNACTDITGFGLLGHLLEMLKDIDLAARLDSDLIPILENVDSFASSGIIPGGSKNNYEHTLKNVYYSNNISVIKKIIFNDAQTSGGLLISVAKEKKDRLLTAMDKLGIKSAPVIGEIIPYENVKILIE